MKDFHKKRLLKLADLMDNLPNEVKFNIHDWANHYGECNNDKPSLHNCGTVACTLGFAAMLPSFKNAGLKLNKDNLPAYKDYIAFEAGEEFFGLAYVEHPDGFNETRVAYLMFDYDGYKSKNPKPKIVAKAIRYFVETGKWKKF